MSFECMLTSNIFIFYFKTFLYAVCVLYFVFHAVWFLWKSLLLSVSINLLYFIISNIIGGKVVNSQNYVFYLESDIFVIRIVHVQYKLEWGDPIHVRC
jgi:hypothetical protein